VVTPYLQAQRVITDPSRLAARGPGEEISGTAVLRVTLNQFLRECKHRYNYSVRTPADVLIAALTNFRVTIQKAASTRRKKLSKSRPLRAPTQRLRHNRNSGHCEGDKCPCRKESDVRRCAGDEYPFPLSGRLDIRTRPVFRVNQLEMHSNERQEQHQRGACPEADAFRGDGGYEGGGDARRAGKEKASDLDQEAIYESDV
jgi:hypothetical protein